ncbi:hypothetical protein [Portibacter marinus]|uniref:hypothetical protein n=1 Tax=Portibacter marinus TaxID=2898660 RepID=UPI001F455061|nr:hypothetical protein [Portibacter marinus]
MKRISIIIIFIIPVVGSLFGNHNPIHNGHDFLNISKLTYYLDSIEAASNKLKTRTSTFQQVKGYQFKNVDQWIKSAASHKGEVDGMEDIDAMEVAYAGNPKVRAAQKAIDGLSRSNLIGALTGAEILQFPIGIKDSINGYTYSLVFHEARILPEYTIMKVYGAIQKKGGVQLMFGSDDIKFTSEGGFIGDATLALFADFPYRPNTSNMAFVFKAFDRNEDGNHGGCYITFDCNGFKSARIEGDVLVSREWILPTDETGQLLPGNQRVKANIGLTVSDFNHIVVNVSLPHFTLTQDTSIAFIVDEVVVDLSETKNAPGFEPPPIFDPEQQLIVSPSPDPTRDALWKGVFIQKIEVILPSVFQQDDDRLAFGAERLYLDHKGITGKFYVDQVLSLDRGSMGATGWAYSMDRLEMSTLYSEVYEFGFDGRVVIPIGDKNQSLRYRALANLKSENYVFDIGVDSLMTIPMWKVGSAVLNENTYLNVGVVNNAFKVQAVLSGTMNIEVSPSEITKNTDLTIADVSFGHLIIQDTLPYVSLGTHGGHITFTAGPILNNSILNVDHASIINMDNDRVMFSIGMEAGPMSEEDGGAKVGGAFGMVARPQMVSNRQSWEFEEMKLMALEIHLDFADAGYIKGGIVFFADDPVYGNGFAGNLEGGFVKDGNRYKFSAAASARFGTMNEGSEEEYKYWSFDVYISSSLMAVPIYPPIAANGFGGGMYHHMSMAGYELGLMAENGLNNPYSGIIYEPDRNTRLGLKATIGLTTTSGKAFQGVVTLELSFNQNLGLREIKLYGTGEIAGSDSEGWASAQKDNISSNVMERSEAAAFNETNAKGKANTISCAVMMRVSLVDGFLMHGNFNTYIDAGQGKIRGQGKLDLLVNVPQDPGLEDQWHLYIGGYADGSISNIEGEVIPPVSVGIYFKTFSITASLYLLMGNDLPGPPTLSPQLAAIFGQSANEINRSKLNEGGRSSSNATGAAFGSSMNVGFTYRHTKKNGEPAKWRYVNVRGGAGFDLALLSFSDQSTCSLVDTFPHGQKGWRAYGRVYLYAEVEGYWLKAFKIHKQFLAFKAEGDLPNPDYFNIDLKIKILNKVDINKNVELGEKCGTVKS